MEVHVFQKYAHVFWIPFFPLGKIGATCCSSCNRVWSEEQMTSGMKEAFNVVKKHSKKPIWMFSGMALVVLLIGWVVIEEKENQKKNVLMLQSPQKGDVIEYKTQNKYYSLLKIIDVNGDSLYVLPHLYESNQMSGIYDLKQKGEEGYDTTQILLFKSDLLEMHEKGDIVDVNRAMLSSK
jgi:hypothetical protein